ncbi:MAG: hypothetical protein HYR96_04715 [Deltaproteobacteria bacterium]|nr:hypothetical protein [Deltaproteobacteria bacterium]MBI3295245.1 hypothetical protein [Deltaproteobacteria bacterium]
MKTSQLVLIGTFTIVIATSGCSRDLGLQVAGSPISTPTGGVGSPFGGYPQPGGFSLGNSVGNQVPVQSQSNPFQQPTTIDPFQNAFVGGQNPWSYLNGMVPPSSANNQVTSTVLTAGTYRLAPSQAMIGAFFQISISPPVTLVNNVAGCSGQLAGQILPNLSICLNFTATQTPVPVPVRFAVQSSSGIVNSTLYVLILPASILSHLNLAVAGAIPPVQINESIGANGQASGQVVPTSFAVQGTNLPYGTNLTSNDPSVQIVPQGQGWMVTTSHRGVLNLTAVSAQTGAPMGSLQAAVPLVYTIKATAERGKLLSSNDVMRFTCASYGPMTQLMVQDGNFAQFLIPLGSGPVTSPNISRSPDKYGRAIITVPGNAGSISCQGVVADLSGSIDNSFLMNIQ